MLFFLFTIFFLQRGKVFSVFALCVCVVNAGSPSGMCTVSSGPAPSTSGVPGCRAWGCGRSGFTASATSRINLSGPRGSHRAGYTVFRGEQYSHLMPLVLEYKSSHSSRSHPSLNDARSSRTQARRREKWRLQRTWAPVTLLPLIRQVTLISCLNCSEP